MNFNLQRHLRIAGTVAILVGFCIRDINVMIFGNLLLVAAYMWSIAKIEVYLEQQTKPKDEEKL